MFLTNPWLFFKNVRLRADPAALTVTPRAATLTRQLRLQATVKAVALAAPAAGLSRTRVLLAGRTALTIAGSAKLNRQLLLRGQQRTIGLATTSAVMQRTRLAGFIKTEVTITPQAAQLKLGRVLKAQPATVNLSAKSANFLKVAGAVQAVPKAITVAPMSANLRASRLLLPSLSEIILAPKPALLLRAYPLLATPAILTLVPQQARLLLQRRLTAVKAEVALAGHEAALVYDPGGASPVYRGLVTDTANLASYGANAQWRGLDVGPAAAGKHLIFMIFGQGTTNNISAASFGGTSLLPFVREDGRIHTAIIPFSGASGDLSVTFTTTQNRAAFAYWSVTGLQSAVPVAVNGLDAGSAATRTVTADVQADGFVVVGGYNGATSSIDVSGGTHTARFNDIVESAVRMAGGDFSPTADELARAFSYTNVLEMSVISLR